MASFSELQRELIFDYDASKFDFRGVIAKMLRCEDRDLSLLHTTVEGMDHAQMLTFAHDQW